MNGASPSRPVRQLLERLERIETRNGSYQALCPAHEDRGPASTSAKAKTAGRS